MLQNVKSLEYFIGIFGQTKDVQVLRGLSLRYGSQLEKLDFESRLALRVVLSRYVHDKSFISGYLIADAVSDTLPDFGESIYEVWTQLQGLSDKSVEILILLLTFQQLKELNADLK